MLTFQHIISTCEEEGRKNYESKVFVLCVLSHGEKGAVYGEDGEPVTIEHLETIFDGNHCKQLATKPKVFLIQACQGGLLFLLNHFFIVFCMFTDLCEATTAVLLLPAYCGTVHASAIALILGQP